MVGNPNKYAEKEKKPFSFAVENFQARQQDRCIPEEGV